MTPAQARLRRAKANLRVLVGAIADVAMPGLAREIDAGTGNGRALKLKRAIIESRIRRAERQNDPGMIEKALAAYWRCGVGNEYYTATTHYFESSFLGPHYRIVEALEAQIAANPRLRTLVEVGCGDGRVLAHCAQRLAGLEAFTGLDLNATVIASNVRTYADRPELRFVQGDARAWLAEHTADGMILMSYGGVMEYLSETELGEIFARLGRRRDTAVAFVEPVDAAHDLEHDPRSHVFGRERSFSHNHRKLLADAGFAIVYADEMKLAGARWLLLVATVNPTEVS